MKAETEVMQPQTKECLQSPEAGRGKEGSSHRASRRSVPCRYADFGHLASKTVREQISVVLSHSVFCNLLQQPYETNTDGVNEDI